MRMFDPSVFKGVFYAHRGLYDNQRGIPENSLPAFRAAAAGLQKQLCLLVCDIADRVLAHIICCDDIGGRLVLAQNMPDTVVFRVFA